MSDAKPSTGMGAPTLAGKVIIPDLTPITESQKQNVEAISSISTEMADSLQTICAEQQATLQSVLQGMAAGLQLEGQKAGGAANSVPDIGTILDGHMLAANSFSATASKMMQSTVKTNATLTQSFTQSMSVIEDVAKKFSGG
ncbi:hypothetical protein [Sneathiella aquimaris]|uniref:hypothetical protein n=1 Tax=Sneathiella aquimaris TaxID=2599305 RepID=UPI00146BF65E|nr:hypothetical protein [Sneathiella aquimaris]